jgi:uncharacterized membrane protein
MPSSRTLAIASVVGTLFAAGAQTVVAADAAPKEKCYGVAAAGKNDCAANGHGCAGQSKVDKDPTEWKFVPAGECEKMGGSKTPGKK